MTNESAKVSMGFLDSKPIHLNDTDAGHYQSGNDRRHNAAFDSGMGGWTGWCGYSLSHRWPNTAAHVTGGGWC